MKKILIYIIPEILCPAIFSYYWWKAGNAEAMGAMAYAPFLATIVIVSGLIGLGLFCTAFYLRNKDHDDWYWFVISACIVGSPALFAVILQFFK